MPLHPTVLWAQRADVLYLTVEISDIKNHKIDLTESKLRFTGVGEKEENEYEAEIEFYKEVDVEKSKQHLTARNLTMAIYKKQEAWWPQLQKGKKLNFVKTDFQKWRDEDDDEEEGPEAGDPMGGLDFQSLMAQAGAAGGLPNMDNLPEGGDSDDEEEEQEAQKA
ncbi:Protein wos2 [Choanephora cucurbitarum]|uniref:Protein wos2 n=1 Tax=Choanephora cucurbitarum TaxID=101091 RepID=A0A1C7N470_9FUNG|nr:Protein wos2 [Choanephora cucurbitarum]